MKNKNFIKLFLVFAFFSISSCETVDLNQTENPSTLNQSYLDPDFTFNYVQLGLANFVNSSNAFTQRVTRQMAMTGGNTYDNAFAPVDFNDNWSTGYNILNAIQMMEPKAIANNYSYARGASKVIRCYVLMTLVDMYGDIPYTEAIQGNANLFPHYDNSASVYKQILLELDDAIAILGQPNTTSNSFKDLYYSSAANWITLAKTLKFKMYNNARLASADLGITDAQLKANMDAIISAGDYIDTPSKDFALKYGDSRTLPNDRHPMYNDQYELGGGAYIGNYMMWCMSTEKGFDTDVNASGLNDPRLHFYFYKQNANPATYTNDTFTLPGRSRPSQYNDAAYASFYNSTLTPYVVSNWVGEASIPSNGFWGRDHGDNSGIPTDADKRTVGGIYPIGGAYGTAGTVQSSGTAGVKGAGIMPILLSSWVHFMKAEAILKVGIAGDAKTEFLTGINQSISKVTTFAPTYLATRINTIQQNALNSNITAYPTYMGTQYDATSGDRTLELIMKEYYIATWGNGIEPYNNYRRTGYPSNFQPTIQPVWGSYFSTALYPATAVNNNPNTPTNYRTRKVFWDKATITLH